MQQSLMDKFLDANIYIDSFEKCKKDSIWKESSQKYEINLLKNVNRQLKEMENRTYKQKPYNEFTLTERGKTREIKAMHIDDRVVLRALCDEILTPNLQKYLIYDNGASVKGKGVDFTRKRLETHLHKYYRHYHTNEGYILLIDFTKFFDNIEHEKLIKEFSKRLDDPKLINFLSYLVSEFKIDVSYMSDEEYSNCLSSVFNAIEYAKIDNNLKTQTKYMDKSIGIGSQLSQIAGLLFPTIIDNYCKIVKQCKYYGRYMDDTYIIHPDKKFLQRLLLEINDICKEYGIHINHKKTQIMKISNTFTFLKVRYSLTETGKVIKRINKDTITRQRRKLKKFKQLYLEGKISYNDIEAAYRSWRGSQKRYMSFNSLKNMDKLYNKLFIQDFLYESKLYQRKENKNHG